jgi:hypothetical protein
LGQYQAKGDWDKGKTLGMRKTDAFGRKFYLKSWMAGYCNGTSFIGSA